MNYIESKEYKEIDSLEGKKYIHNTARWIIEQGKKAYNAGQKGMINGLVQNAVEVPNCNYIKIKIDGNNFSIENNGNKFFTEKDALEVSNSLKEFKIGQNGEEIKLAISWFYPNEKDCTPTNPKKINCISGGFLFILTPYRVKDGIINEKLPPNVTTRFFGVLEEIPDVNKLVKFLISVHNVNLDEGKYKIEIDNNGEKFMLSSRLPVNPELKIEKLKGDTIQVFKWEKPEWNDVCPYTSSNGVFLLSDGVLITQKSCWGTEAHKKGFMLINDKEGKLFSKIVTRDKLVPNENELSYSDAHKIWKKYKSSEKDDVSLEEMRKKSTKNFNNIMRGSGKDSITIKLSFLGYTNCISTDIKKKIKCNSKIFGVLNDYDNSKHKWQIETTKSYPKNNSILQVVNGNGKGTVIIENKVPTFKYRCTNNNISEKDWNKRLDKISPKPIGCVFEVRLTNKENKKLQCSKCGESMKRVIEQPDQNHGRFSVEFVSETDYKGWAYIKIGDALGKIVFVNTSDPLFSLHESEYSTKFIYTEAYFIECGVAMNKKIILSDDLNAKELDLIQRFNKLRDSKKQQLKKIKSKLEKQGIYKEWFKNY